MDVTFDRPFRRPDIQTVTTYREVWRVAPFRVLFGARTLAIVADTLRIVALSLLVYAATESPALAALAYGISFLPQLFGSGLLGALADRLPPRRLIALGYLGEAGAAVALALVPMPVWACLVLVAAVACVTPVFHGAANRLIAEVLPGDAYVLGRSLSNLASSLAQLAGLAGAGIAVAALGEREAILCAAAGHLVAALWTRLGLPALSLPATTGRLITASLRGNVALLKDPAIRRLLLTQWLPPGFVTGAEALVVPYAADRGLPAGWLLAAVPVGMIIGNLVVGRMVAPATRERLVPVLIAAMGAPLLVFLTNAPWPGLVAALVVVGGGFAFGLGVQAAFRDALPDGGGGQAFALLSTGLMTAQGLLPALAGLLAEALAPGAVIALLGLATLATAAPGLVRRQDRRHQEQRA
ncbi:MFS transporter [Dactylosporangium sp. AC04546]|uniref:MFS transporter n=1 Tax=Dactylosporangium sp. AC04546 TaxID=2862460 RepID=UPI001EE08293|nr:MFS transporter [Dactylosporangium sp. AC04546]WVK83622.1 MFS transporter [Dactylosporangium sp. AC04546]